MNRNRSTALLTVLSVFVTLASGTALSVAGQPPFTDIAFTPDGRCIIACSQQGISVFSWPALEPQQTVQVGFDNLHCLAFSPDGLQLAAGGGNPGESGGVQVFNWPSLEPVQQMDGHLDSVMAVAWTHTSELVSASRDRTAKRWNVETRKLLQTYTGHSRGVTAICTLNDALSVSAGQDQSLRVWETATGDLVRSLSQHTQTVHALAKRPTSDGLPWMASAADDRTIRFWQPTIGRMVRFIRLESRPLDLAWVNESLLVASCADGQAYWVDTERVETLRSLPAVSGWAYAIAVHPRDGSIAVAGSDAQLVRLQSPDSE